MSCEHNWQPVDRMPAVYRCRACGAFAYKQRSRTSGFINGEQGDGIGTNEMTLYKCHHKGCENPVVVMFPEVRYRRIHKPSCAEHRPDRQPKGVTP